MKPREERPEAGPDVRPIRNALIQFVVRSVLAAVLVGVATLLVARSMSERVAIDEARTRGDAFARAVAAPMVTAAVRNGSAPETAAFASVMEGRLRQGSIVHMKLWGVDGTVLWSDEAALIGRTFRLEEPVRSQAGGSFTHAELSDLSRPENASETSEDKLLEVYVGTTDADGVPMIFETYWSAARLHDHEQQLLGVIAPLSLGGQLLLLLLMVPLGVFLARTATHTMRERNRMLHHALSASDLERRRVSELLHDGVIQDLAGLGYTLPTATQHLPDGPETGRVRDILDRATALIRHDVTALRRMLIDTYPPSLEVGELGRPIHELAAKAEESGVVVSVEILVDAPPALDTNRLVYRIVREALLNVVAHSGGNRAWVRIAADSERVEVSVRDNGVSVGTADPGDQESGHFGLRLLSDTVGDLGGELTIETLDTGGTVLKASFPSNW